MGVSSRLARVFSQLKEGVSVPVLIVSNGPPTSGIVASIERTIGRRTDFQSPLGNAVGVSLNRAEAERVAALLGVKSVELDEPISALYSIRGG